MAELTITVGQLSATATFDDNAKVQKTLLAYFDLRGLARGDLPSELTNQQKLDRVVADLGRHVVDTVRQQEVRSRRHAVLNSVESDVNDEYDFTNSE